MCFLELEKVRKIYCFYEWMTRNGDCYRRCNPANWIFLLIVSSWNPSVCWFGTNWLLIKTAVITPRDLPRVSLRVERFSWVWLILVSLGKFGIGHLISSVRTKAWLVSGIAPASRKTCKNCAARTTIFEWSSLSRTETKSRLDRWTKMARFLRSRLEIINVKHFQNAIFNTKNQPLLRN